SRAEGSTKLNHAIRKLGYNKDVTVRLGTVKNPPPNLVIKADDIGFDLEADDVIVLDYLLAHERTVSIEGGTVSGNTSGGQSLTAFSINSAKLTVKSPLTTGARVVILDDE